MFKFLRRRGNLRDDGASDIITEAVNINISDSAPILSRNFDLTNSNNSHALSIHDLRRSNDGEVSLVKRSLRTIPGVFCPVALSMCSVAIFMRIGFIVGHAGVWQSIALFALAFSIFVLTGLSVCAISTNGAIQGGGVYCKFKLFDYYNFFFRITKILILDMISRTLGPEFGGSIGTLFFFANAIGSAFNGAALVEALLSNYGSSSKTKFFN